MSPNEKTAGLPADIQGETTMRNIHRLHRDAIAACALALAISGCAGSSLMWPTTQPSAPGQIAGDKPIPRVQNCININSGTPSKYVCNGKTYTSHELRKLREDGASAAMASK
jgi:hypothetical protein